MKDQRLNQHQSQKLNQKSNLVESYAEFRARQIAEAEAYDEPTDSPSASMRQEDWTAKDKLNFIQNIAEELTLFIEDGEQLEPSQRTLIDKMYDDINMLKRQIEGREQVKSQEEEDMYDKIDNPNL